jgi:hypothetical protein
VVSTLVRWFQVVVSNRQGWEAAGLAIQKTAM